MSSRTLLAAALALALGGVNGDDLPMPPPVFPTPQAETPVGGTPNGYVAWVTGLSAGDTVTATMWFKGASNGVDDDGKGKIWGQYTSPPTTTSPRMRIPRPVPAPMPAKAASGPNHPTPGLSTQGGPPS